MKTCCEQTIKREQSALYCGHCGTRLRTREVTTMFIPCEVQPTQGRHTQRYLGTHALSRIPDEVWTLDATRQPTSEELSVPFHHLHNAFLEDPVHDYVVEMVTACAAPASTPRITLNTAATPKEEVPTMPTLARGSAIFLTRQPTEFLNTVTLGLRYFSRIAPTQTDRGCGRYIALVNYRKV